jgi:methionyl-tRNA formyltransferase
MKIGFIGCVRSSERALNTLLSLRDEGIQIVGVITKESSPVNSDHVDLGQICKAQTIPYIYEAKGEQRSSIQFMQDCNPDVIYCFGWSYLLNEAMLELAPMGAIGFHPAKLPNNRGRHPIIWSLVLGLECTASTFFRMDQGADSGPILSQREIPILASDNATTLYEKILDISQGQILNFTRELASGQAAFVEQDNLQSTYWRKRTRADGLIDWRMHAADIHCLIRALTDPYPGAEFVFNGEAIKVWESRLVDSLYPRNIEPGYVLKVEGLSILVKCSGEGALWLHKFGSSVVPQVGDYL